MARLESCEWLAMARWGILEVARLFRISQPTIHLEKEVFSYEDKKVPEESATFCYQINGYRIWVNVVSIPHPIAPTLHRVASARVCDPAQKLTTVKFHYHWYHELASVEKKEPSIKEHLWELTVIKSAAEIEAALSAPY